MILQQASEISPEAQMLLSFTRGERNNVLSVTQRTKCIKRHSESPPVYPKGVGTVTGSSMRCKS